MKTSCGPSACSGCHRHPDGQCDDTAIRSVACCVTICDGSMMPLYSDSGWVAMPPPAAGRKTLPL
eukprot:14663-Prymnesium_polylepis.1